MDLSLFKAGVFTPRNFHSIERKARIRRQQMGMNPQAVAFAELAAFRACYTLPDQGVREAAQRLLRADAVRQALAHKSVDAVAGMIQTAQQDGELLECEAAVALDVLSFVAGV